MGSNTSISSTTPSSRYEFDTTSDASGVISPVSKIGISGMASPQHTGTLGIDVRRGFPVTFRISAVPDLEPVHNLGGWKVQAPSKTCSELGALIEIVDRGEFRACAQRNESVG